jgi:hypothetical protein
MMRLNGPSGVTVLNLEDNLAQLQLTQGAMNVRVRHLDPAQVIEVDTPNLAFTIRQPGSYRVAVDADGNATDVVVRNGRAEVYGDGAVVCSRLAPVVSLLRHVAAGTMSSSQRRVSTTSIAGRPTATVVSTLRSRPAMSRRM